MIRRVWERLLCKIGHHDWDSIVFVWGGSEECVRCGKVVRW